MILNKDTRIVGELVILVPYREQHVEKYHNWMQSEELQVLTASEALTLEEEYLMQKSWMFDENKCTFIVLDKQIYESTQCEIAAMIGDTNLFFANDIDRMVAEAEIMIAVPEARRQHRGLHAIVLMLLYGTTTFPVRQYVVKIGLDNATSIGLFRDKLGFVETARSEVFHEVTLNRIVDEQWLKTLREIVGHFEMLHETN